MSKTIMDAIDSRLTEISVSDELKTKILNNSHKKKKSIKRPFGIAAAVTMCILLSASVLAATNEVCNELLSIISPKMAQILMPLNLTSEDTGIKMKIIAAASDEDTAVIYLSLQDLTADRLGDNMELNIEAPGLSDKWLSYYKSSYFSNKIISYDKNTKTAMVQLISTKDILKDKKVNLKLCSISIGRKDYEVTDTGVNLSSIISSSTAKSEYSTLKLDNMLKNVLKPDQKHIAVKDMGCGYISNIGYIDGQLHIQAKITGTNNDFCAFYLTDKSGNQTYSSHGYTDFKAEDGYIYYEAVFDVEDSELNKYTLGAGLSTYTHYTEGNWNSEFKLKDEKSKEINCNVSFKGLEVNKVSLSPLGVKITGAEDKSVSVRERYLSREKDSVLVKMNNGSILTLNKAWNEMDKSHSMKNKNTAPYIGKYLSSEPIKVEDVKEILINGIRVEK